MIKGVESDLDKLVSSLVRSAELAIDTRAKILHKLNPNIYVNPNS